MKHTPLPATANVANLNRMADYIETIPQEKFDMVDFRKDDLPTEYECNTVGCIIGHCTILDEMSNMPKYPDGWINFFLWSKQFTGLELNSDFWRWCFSGSWVSVDNTPTGAARRIRYTINNGIPENWKKQMYGDEPLIY